MTTNTDKATKVYTLDDCKNESKFGYEIPTQTTMANGNMTFAT